jgi:hypothetical protein
MPDTLACLSAAYKEVIGLEPLSDSDSPRTRHIHGQLLSSTNMIIGQMYAHIQGVAAASALEDDEELPPIDDGQGSWGRSCIYLVQPNDLGKIPDDLSELMTEDHVPSGRKHERGESDKSVRLPAFRFKYIFR